MRQIRDYSNFTGVVSYTPDVRLPSAVMVDIDGTLAHMKGRGPFDWSAVGTDIVDDFIRTIVQGLSIGGKKIVIMSGRDGCCKDETTKWLVKNKIPYDELIMRTAGDSRKDSIVKEELFWENVAKKYNVIGVIDDRNQVVQMWMILGIKVLHAGNPWHSF